MKFTKKTGRVLSALLAAAMVVTSSPESFLTARAAESAGSFYPPHPQTLTAAEDAAEKTTLEDAPIMAMAAGDATMAKLGMTNFSGTEITLDDSSTAALGTDDISETGAAPDGSSATVPGASDDSETGIAPGDSSATEPGTGDDSETGIAPGDSSAAEPGAGDDSETGTAPGDSSAAEPGTGDDSEAGTAPDDSSAAEPGTGDDSEAGTAPDDSSAAEPGTDDDSETGTAPGDSSAAEPGAGDDSEAVTPFGESVDIMASYCAVTFRFGQQYGNDISMKLKCGERIDPSIIPVPKVENRVIKEWRRMDGSVWDFENDIIPTGQISMYLYATWVYFGPVTFHMMGKGENIVLPDMLGGTLLDISENEALLWPRAEDFCFDGWYKSQSYTTKWDFLKDTIETDLTLYAKWTESPTYTVTFDLCGHGDNMIKKDVAGRLVKIPSLTPTAKGFRFGGWYKDPEYKEVWDLDTDTVEGNITLYAKWDESTYTVTFDMQGKGEDMKLTVREDSLIEQTEALRPTAEGCHFENWYKDPDFTDVWDFSKDTVTGDITLYAKWKELAEGEFVVTFHLSGHGADFYQYLTTGSKLDEAAIRPADETEYRFMGWYKSADFAESGRWNFEQDTITGSITLYAKWEEIFYTVTFDLAGKGANLLKTGFKPGSLIPKTEDLQPAAAGFVFDNWYRDAQCTLAWDFTRDTVTDDMTLYAKWIPLYTVTFNLSGHGADIVKKDILEGSLIEQTADLKPKAEGFHFENWYRDQAYTSVWDFDQDTVTSDLTLYAKWQDLTDVSYIVTFDLMGHGADFFQYIRTGDNGKITRPQEPASDGFLFLNWCTDTGFKTIWDFDKDTVTENMTLYAKWKDITSLRLSAIAPQPYTGKAIKPAVSVYSASDDASDDSNSQLLLKSGKDYSVKYFNNVNTNALLLAQGTAAEDDTVEGGYNTTGEKGVGGFNPALPYVLIEAKGNYEGKVYMNFVISQIALGDENNNAASGITLQCNDQLAIGTPKKDQKIIASLKYKAALKEGTDYTASISGLAESAEGSVIPKTSSIWTEGGDCTLTITGIGNYTGTIVRPIIVRAKDTLLAGAKLSLGAKCKSKPLSSAGEDGVTLIPAWSETVEEDVYDKNDEPVYDKNGDIKTKKVTYYYQYINGSWESDGWEYDDEKDKDVYRKLDRGIAFTVKIGSKWLKYGDDYTISYANNQAVGTATMTITGTGEYTGSKSVTFKITGKAFNASTVTFQKDEDGGGWISKFAYDGTEKTQSVTLESKKRNKVYDCGYENGDEEEYEDKNGDWHTRRHKHNKNCDYHMDIDHIFSADEYTVSYVNNVKVGTATAIFTANPAMGYSGSFKKTFQITGISMAESVTFNGEGETLEPRIDDYDEEVPTGKKDEDGEPIYKERHVHKVYATRYMEGTRPYSGAGATLNFTLTAEGSEEPLILNRDYTISYKNNKSVTPWKTRKWRDKWQEEDENGKPYWEYGEWEYEDYPVDSKMGALTITGKGNYSGKITIKYVITRGTMDTDGVHIEVARSEYNPKTNAYKPKVTVWTDGNGPLSSKEYKVNYHNNSKAAVAAYLNGEGDAPAPEVTVTFSKSNNYDNLRDEKDEDGAVTPYEPITSAPVPMTFYDSDKKLTAKTVYIIIDNDNPRELVYTGTQVTNVSARVYFGSAEAVKAAQRDQVTNHRLLTKPQAEGGLYGLTLLAEADGENAGDYTLTYGANKTIGKNKGSFTVNGTGIYGGSVTQKFTIYRNPVSYNVVTPVIDSE